MTIKQTVVYLKFVIGVKFNATQISEPAFCSLLPLNNLVNCDNRHQNHNDFIMIILDVTFFYPFHFLQQSGKFEMIGQKMKH